MNKIFLILILLFLPAGSFAHEDGASFEAQVGDYTLDIGYRNTISGEPALLDFDIFEGQSKESLPWTSVWVRLVREGRTVFAGPIAHGEFGKPGISIVLHQAGDYEVFARFERGTSSLAETNFVLSVIPGEDRADGLMIWISSAVLVFVVLAGFLIKKYA